jgi:hypothetical protein
MDDANVQKFLALADEHRRLVIQMHDLQGHHREDKARFWKATRTPSGMTGTVTAQALSDHITLTGPPGLHADIWRCHVETLATELGVTVYYAQSRLSGAAAWSAAHAVYVQSPETLEGYLSGLHELGHCATREAAKRCRSIDRFANTPDQHRVSPLSELLAWDWARAHAKPTWTTEMACHARRCLQTYVPFAEGDELAAFARWNVFVTTQQIRDLSTIQEQSMEPEPDIIEVKTTIAGREVGADGGSLTNRLRRTAELCTRARETGQRCELCGERLATTLHHDHVQDRMQFRCDHCAGDRLTRRGTSNEDIERYLQSKGIA